MPSFRERNFAFSKQAVPNAQRHQPEYLRLAALRYQSQALKSPARLCRQEARRGSISNEENPAREAKADLEYEATVPFALINKETASLKCNRRVPRIVS
jgi:hypothetical protein